MCKKKIYILVIFIVSLFCEAFTNIQENDKSEVFIKKMFQKDADLSSFSVHESISVSYLNDNVQQKILVSSDTDVTKEPWVSHSIQSQSFPIMSGMLSRVNDYEYYSIPSTEPDKLYSHVEYRKDDKGWTYLLDTQGGEIFSSSIYPKGINDFSWYYFENESRSNKAKINIDTGNLDGITVSIIATAITDPELCLELVKMESYNSYLFMLGSSKEFQNAAEKIDFSVPITYYVDAEKGLPIKVVVNLDEYFKKIMPLLSTTITPMSYTVEYTYSDFEQIEPIIVPQEILDSAVDGSYLYEPVEE